MKKIILFLSLCTLFNSCQVSFGTFMKYLPEVAKELDYVTKETRMAKKTETMYHYGKKSSFVFENGKIYIPCKINDTTRLLFYNTDDLSWCFCEQISANTEFPKTNKTIKVRTRFPNVTMKKGLRYYNMESIFFNSKQYVGRIYSLSNDTITPICISNNIKSNFSINMDVFPKWKDVMLLNFSDTTITLLNHYAAFLDGVDTYDTTGYIPIKSRYTCRGLSLWLTIDSIEYEFLFNTDYSESLSLPYYQPHKKEKDTFIVRYRGKKDFHIVSDTIIHQVSNAIIMGESNTIEGDILYTKSKSYRPTIGMEFISRFDWIIDMNDGGKVYAKKIKENSPRNYYINFYRVSIVDSTLRITLLPVGEEKHQLYSIIDSVNGEKVNMDNICQMKDLLNKENGFLDNEIVVLPFSESGQIH